jgi:hypothetical protein
MLEISLSDKEIAGLERKLSTPGIPEDEAAFMKFLIKKYKNAKEKEGGALKQPTSIGWTFTWSYRFG